MRAGRAKLAVVSNSHESSPAIAKELSLYAEVRSAANDRERWRRMHERSDLNPAIIIASKARRIFAMKGGARRERGGFKFDERL